MATAVQLLLCSLLASTLPHQTFACEATDSPLLLSTYLDKDQADEARILSRVNRDCVDNFVPDSHSGFLTVDKELGNHLFFWFFPSTENERAPVLLWLNGGPTVSSMLGLFYENGPMEMITSDLKVNVCGKERQDMAGGYRKREYSWTRPFSMLYVDNPVDVGFSFSDSGKEGHRVTREGYTKDLASFMNEFFKLFPEYKSRELYLGGQSYAGKYIISLAYEIHTQMLCSQSHFNLTGIYLGAPWFDPETQSKAANDFFFAMGAMTEQSRQNAVDEIERFYARAKTEIISNQEASDFAYKKMLYIKTGSSSKDNYVTRQAAPYDVLGSFLSNSPIRRAIHVGNRAFHELNMPLFMQFFKDRLLVSLKSELAQLMNFYKVLIYNGDYDAAVALNGLEASLLTTPWKNQTEYNSSVRSLWQRNDNDVIGYYSLTDKFCRVVIRGSGHQTPHDTPEIAFYMMKQFVEDGCVRDYKHTVEKPLPEPCASSVAKTSSNIAFLLTSLMTWSLMNYFAA